MKSKITKIIVIVILVLLGLIDIGGLPQGMDQNSADIMMPIIIGIYVGYYFLLNNIFHFLRNKKWLDSYVALKSALLIIGFLIIIRIITYTLYHTIF